MLFSVQNLNFFVRILDVALSKTVLDIRKNLYIKRCSLVSEQCEVNKPNVGNPNRSDFGALLYPVSGCLVFVTVRNHIDVANNFIARPCKFSPDEPQQLIELLSKRRPPATC